MNRKTDFQRVIELGDMLKATYEDNLGVSALLTN
jgi:hypothetical protein